MVIANPKLALPTDLPYKKRQRPFNPNTPLQQATIRYNEALRKQYNDVQFERQFENGCISQNELLPVNTIDITKTLDPALLAEMSNMNPLPVMRQRKSRRFDHAPPGTTCGNGSSGDYMPLSCSSGYHLHLHPTSHHHLQHPPVDKIFQTMGTDVHERGQNPFPTNNGNANNANFIDCNDMEMFPHLTASPHEKPSGTFIVKGLTNNSPNSSGSLEVQAINEYEPTIDSAHDMIFGNVMGIDYGNYVHDHLWALPQPTGQECPPNANNCYPQFSPQQQHPSPQQHQQFHPCPHPNNMCVTSKSVGYNLASTLSSPPNPYFNFERNVVNGNATGASPIMGSHLGQSSGSTGPGSSRRSTSVPRPRTGTRKETLKQAAIRCGIIKGNQTVPTIHKRSQCLAPLNLSPVLSDPVVSVVEILHPRPLIPTCSSEALVEACLSKSKSGASNVSPRNEHMLGTEKRTSDDGRVLTEIRPVSDFRAMENTSSSPSF